MPVDARWSSLWSVFTHTSRMNVLEQGPNTDASPAAAGTPNNGVQVVEVVEVRMASSERLQLSKSTAHAKSDEGPNKDVDSISVIPRWACDPRP